MIFRFDPRFCPNFTLTNEFHYHLIRIKQAKCYNDTSKADNRGSVCTNTTQKLAVFNSILKYHSRKKIIAHNVKLANQMWLLMMQISLLSDLRLFVSKNDFLQEGVVRFQ